MYRPKYLDVEKRIVTFYSFDEVLSSEVVEVGPQGKRGTPPRYDANRYKRKYGITKIKQQGRGNLRGNL